VMALPIPRVSPTPADQALFAEIERLIRAVPGPHPQRILPAGSRAMGTARPESDLDLVVILPDEEMARPGARQLLYEAASALTVDSGVVVEVLAYGEAEAARLARLPSNPVRQALGLAGDRLDPVTPEGWQTMARDWVARADAHLAALAGTVDDPNASDPILALYAQRATVQLLTALYVAREDGRRPPKDPDGLRRAVALGYDGWSEADVVALVPDETGPLDRHAVLARVRTLRDQTVAAVQARIRQPIHRPAPALQTERAGLDI